MKKEKKEKTLRKMSEETIASMKKIGILSESESKKLTTQVKGEKNV